MRELSLFSGGGGGLLGTKLLGWDHIGYVEINEYCQRVIAQRIKDGFLDKAPIFTDVREFLQSGAAKQYRGFADVVTAGFPCQPFSIAGKQDGENDKRNMWPATIAIIREVRPQYCFLENVPGLLAHEYVRTIFGELAESGFDVKWRVLSAAEVGAPHKRDRVWIVANCNSSKRGQRSGEQPERKEYCSSSEAELANTSCKSSNGSKHYRKDSTGKICKSGNRSCKNNVSNTNSTRRRAKQINGPYGENTAQLGNDGEEQSVERSASSWWAVEPGMGRVANGVANRVDRLKALGNGQVSAVVKAAWELLK